MQDTSTPQTPKGSASMAYIAGALVLVLVAGGLYIYFRRHNKSGQPQAMPRQVITVPVTQAPKGKLAAPELKEFVMNNGQIISSGVSTFPIASTTATVYSARYVLGTTIFTLYQAYDTYLKGKGYTITSANATDDKMTINAHKPYETVGIVGTRVDAKQVEVQVNLTKTN